ncbi:MAG: type II secretion system F family protein, partial [Candidatus Peregrinibacteria bacterium]
MTALVHKIRDGFADVWLKTELWLGKHFKSKPKVSIPTPLSVSTPAQSTSAIPKPVVSAPVAVQPKPKTEKQSFSLRMLRLSAKERLFLFDQLATLVGSGVPLINSLTVIRAQTKQQSLKKLYTEMLHHINAGMGLAQTMRLFPNVFPSMQVALIEAGEKSGNLKLVFEDLTEDMEAQQEFLRKITGAMFYPMLLLIMAVSLVTGMMIFVIPRVAAMYTQAKVKLPALTQTMINISNFVRDQWPLLLGGIVGGVILLWLFFGKTRPGRLAWEKFVGIFPAFGTIAKEKNLMILAGNMAMLLKSGVLISEAFQITQATLGNLHYQRALEQVRHDVVMGKSVSESMGLKNIEDKHFKEDKLFPLQFSQLVHIGESTGTISQMLMKLRQNYHKSIDYKLKNISTVIEPLMIMVVAFLVGSILLAVMLPFFYIGTTIN